MSHFQLEQLKKAKEYAMSKNGICLSENYVAARDKLKWKCEKGHEWEAIFGIVQRGSWCAKCKSNFLTKEDGILNAKKHAELKGGKCLSEEYKKSNSNLIWTCAKNHKWEANYNSVVNRGSWCPICAGRFSKEEGLKKAKEYAISKNGVCLSEKYVEAKDKIKWRCHQNHEWYASWNSISSKNSWCPQCSSYYYKEHKVRDLLEYLLDTKFEKNRPKWNINPKTNKPLELDGYSEELKIAFEFQGVHHYEVGIFNNDIDALNYTKYKDNIKKQNCLDNNIKLIIIDDKFSLKEEEFFLKNILDLLKNNEIFIEKKIDEEKIKEIFQKTVSHQDNYLLEAKNYAENKDGVCLSEKYISAKDKLLWKCSYGHEWSATFSNVLNGNTWCPQCTNRKIDENGKYIINENGLKEAQDYAKSKHGLCLSEKYESANKKLKWKCNNPNHDPWNASFSKVVNTHTWCPQCYGIFPSDYKLKKAKEYAKSKSGECLSENYINANTKLEWKCNEPKHDVWLASYNMVVNNNTWCPQCSGKFNKNHYLQLAKEYAKSKGGTCLSENYESANKKLEWICKLNHRWDSSYTSVVLGEHWCSICAKNKNKNKNE